MFRRIVVGPHDSGMLRQTRLGRTAMPILEHATLPEPTVMEKTVTITLSERELLDLEAILVDEDQTEALRFLREVIKRKVTLAEEGHCRPPSEWR